MKFIATALLALSLTGCGVMIKVPNDPVSNVVKVQATGDDLFVRANKWAVTNFTNADSVIQFSDKESGTIAGRYLLYTPPANPLMKFYAGITIETKDNAARLTVTPEETNYLYDPVFMFDHYTKERADALIAAMFVKFNEYMNTPVDNDW